MLSKLFSAKPPLKAKAQLKAKPQPKEKPHQYGAKAKDDFDLYRPQRSFTDHLPWVESLAGEDALLLDDGRSVGAVFKLTPLGAEGRGQAFLEELRDSICAAITTTFDEKDISPWVMQTYTFNEPELEETVAQLSDYVLPALREDTYTQTYLKTMNQHLNGVGKTDSLFYDDQVTRTHWSGKQLCNYLVIYRRLSACQLTDEYGDALDPVKELNDTCQKLIATLMPVGFSLSRLTGAQFHQWMTRFFNYYTQQCPDDPTAFSKLVALTDEDLKIAHDFGQSTLYCMPRSDPRNKCWIFDNTVGRCLAIDSISKAPMVAHLIGEQTNGESINTLLDRLPRNTMMVTTMVALPQDTIEQHIGRIANAAIGDSVDAERTRADCSEAKKIMGNREKMYRAHYAVYLRADRLETLNKYTTQARSALLSAGFRVISAQDDARSLDNYLSNLPMKYDPDLDAKSGWLTAKLTWAQHIANILPFMGRSVGTGNPGFLGFNRGGEAFCVDPLNKQDRVTNSHMLIVGPTGSGKSASIASITAHMLAIKRPRIFIIEVGNSFGLLLDYFKENGLTVNDVTLKPGNGVTLPIYADAHRLFDQRDHCEQNEPESEDEQRDLLGELETATLLMITGGERRELELIRRSDRRIIRDAILQAAKKTLEENRTTLIDDVRQAFYDMAMAPDLSEGESVGIRQMGNALGLFCDGFEGEVFNCAGESWPEVDVTRVDLATFAREGYEAQLAIAVISLLTVINNMAERDQFSDRNIITVIDEAHITTSNALLSPYLVKIVKMWRKLGAWLWLGTQNVKDFPGESEKLLNMMEWWMCLVMPKNEVDLLTRFKELTPDQEHLLQSATKSHRKYTEGVLMNQKINALFRNIPPSLILALVMNEKEEKSKRQAIMTERGCTEVEAAKVIAEQLDKARGII